MILSQNKVGLQRSGESETDIQKLRERERERE